ncbi:protein SHI RELATED SEQUENCE 3 [Silene latifolia]|uniref:protein SHI RELATED SEQUENCE 3 n=1 Tax=Silene latifolia TaxID=37657 RepID=UPI003D789D5E
MRSSSTGGNNNNNNNSSSSSSEIISCQDCGNKAKRDCEHRRCRTCCKTRGFPCPTHIKSTWVPVARRRLRQQHLPFHHHFNLPLSLSTPSPFHPHLAPPSGSGGGNFPAEVNSLATFRCIRVSSEDNVVEQYAYQTSINIGGHIFKGILYDQGDTTTVSADQSSSAGTSDHPHHQFRIAAATTATAQSGDGANLLYPPHPHPSLYSTPFNAFLPGMQFFPHPRP